MEKTKRIVASILALSLLFLCVACDNETVKMEKWVLVEEKNVLVMENGVEETQYEKSYGYDSFGRKIFEKQNDHGEISNCSDFQYDNKGNMISCLVTVTVNEDIVNTYSNSYSYDSNNNLLEYSSKGSDFTTQIQYQYNEKGYMIYEEQSYISDSYERTEFVKYTPYFENDVCIQSEIARTFSDLEGTNYWLDKYSYDENGNMISVHQYIETEKANSNIEHNGRYYQLSYITYYTYEEITVEELVVENSYDVTLNNANENIGYEETTTEAQKKLSDECDKVLGVGRDNNGNIYELVAKETESYSGLVIEIGVIKNNEWFVNLTSDNSLIDENHLLYGSDLEYVTAEYIADNCFFIKRQYYKYAFGVVYNFNLDAVESLSQYVYTNEWAGPLALPCYSSTGEILISKDHYAQPNFTILDTKTMKTKEINVGYVDYFAPISEGVFAVVKKEGYSNILSFYDTNGNKVLTFPQYDVSCIDCDDNWIFVDGKCKFTLYNNNETLYQITIDKQGNVLSSIEM